MFEEPTVFITHSEVEARLKKREGKSLMSSVYLNLKPTFSVEVAAKPYLRGYVVLKY